MSDSSARRVGRWWIVAGIAVVACVIAVIVVVVVDDGSTHHRSGTPTAAAQAWATAHFHHNLSAERALTCPGQSSAAELLDVTSGAVTGYTAGNATSDGTNSWTVQLTVHQVGGDSTFPLHVIRSNGKYLVC